MKENYPYRFKTEKEFIKEFGLNWRERASFNNEGRMDYLCGKDYPYYNVPDYTYYQNKFLDYKVDGWYIQPKMLTKNKPKVPNYNPRKINREI